MIVIKRIYLPPDPRDGVRVLVDRLWPRRLSKAETYFDYWLKEVAPSRNLRKKYGYTVNNWELFKQHYFRELDQNRDEIDLLIKIAQRGTVTLLFAARDEIHNNAAALKEYLDKRLE